MTQMGPIAAIATGESNSPIGIIRISGTDLLSAGLPFLKTQNLKTVDASSLHRQVMYCRFVDQAGNVLDDGLVSFFKGPASFTGEDVVEIALHGNHILLKDCLSVLADFGIRPAGPGEFSKRAYLNNKLDLSQAEAIQDLITAQNRFALEKSRQNLDGYIGRQTSKLRSFVINLKADLEAELDFMDQDIEFADRGQVIEQTTELLALLDELLKQGKLGRNNSQGLWTVITGKPNVGKSTMLNLILGFERAIVSPAAGTTRDYLEEGIELGGQNLRLYDTAGIRQGNIDSVEKAGIERSLSLKKQANIEIHVRDLTDEESVPELKPMDQKKLSLGPGDPVHLCFYNKSDLYSSPLPETFKLFSHENAYYVFGNLTEASARDNILQILEELVNHHFNASEGILLNERISYLLAESQDELVQVLDLIKAGESPEYICTHLNTVLEHVGDITGRIDTEEVLGRIFSRFCIGK